MANVLAQDAGAPDSAYYLQCNGTDYFGDYSAVLGGMLCVVVWRGLWLRVRKWIYLLRQRKTVVGDCK
jgi:hypothetical protein